MSGRTLSGSHPEDGAGTRRNPGSELGASLELADSVEEFAYEHGPRVVELEVAAQPFRSRHPLCSARVEAWGFGSRGRVWLEQPELHVALHVHDLDTRLPGDDSQLDRLPRGDVAIS